MSLALVPSWVHRLNGRVYLQFSQSNWAPPLATVLGEISQPLQAAWSALSFMWSIDPITDDVNDAAYGIGRGVQLDRIGQLVGEPRGASDDDHYRYYLRATVRSNHSRGTVDDIEAVFVAMFGPTCIPVYYAGGNASFEMELPNPMTDAVAEIARQFLERSRMAGVRGLLLTQDVADEGTFFTDDAAYLTVAALAGDGSVTLDFPSEGFPSNGTVVLDQGTTAEETIDYTARTVTTMTLDGTLANAHPINCSVSFVNGAIVVAKGLGTPFSVYMVSASIAGATTIHVSAVVGLPNPGLITIDGGTVVAETVAYTFGGGDALTVPALAFAHAIGASVDLVNADGIGTGGDLQRVAEG